MIWKNFENCGTLQLHNKKKMEGRFLASFTRRIVDSAMHRDEKLIEEYIMHKKRRVVAKCWKLIVLWFEMMERIMHLCGLVLAYVITLFCYMVWSIPVMIISCTGIWIFVITRVDWCFYICEFCSIK